ncbi:hypothetical protein HK102_004177 [Quaeritorhiza haematococci]|nr:hypothetical protein HK102_004177 [Quaeritorhiza haematococci]
MGDPLDMSLDDIVAGKNQKRRNNGGGPLRRRPDARNRNSRNNNNNNDNAFEVTITNDRAVGSRRNNRPTPYSRPSSRSDDSYAAADGGRWAHDKFEESEGRGRGGGGGRSRGQPGDRRGGNDGGSSNTIRVENLHWNVSEQDLNELFGEIGPTKKVKMYYDKAGRSEGHADIEYVSRKDAEIAFQQYNGRELDEQAMKITFLGGGGSGRGNTAGGNSGNNNQLPITARLGSKPGSILQRLGSRVGGGSGGQGASGRQATEFKVTLDGGATRGGGGGSRPRGGSGGGRGPTRGRGRGRGGPRGAGRQVTKEDLDAEMDSFMSGDVQDGDVEMGGMDVDDVNGGGAVPAANGRSIISYEENTAPPDGGTA